MYRGGAPPCFHSDSKNVTLFVFLVGMLEKLESVGACAIEVCVANVRCDMEHSWQQ